MTTDSLTLFARQLAAWARQIIENGRSPFRKVELAPPVQTACGEARPPLVFWINRQSLMAGGILTLPGRRADEDLERSAACARALGLRHFVSWAQAEIVFWQTEDGEPPTRCKSVPLEGTDDMDIERFRDELSMVMDELKLLSVTGNIAPPDLSEHYIANLCFGYLDGSRQRLAETFRIARGEGRISEDAAEPEGWARQRAALSLFQLLGLSFNDLLPDSVQPERLEQAMRLHLPELPPGLNPPSEDDEDLPLPEDVAVSLHHLFRRLGQVGWHRDPQRALATVRLLMKQLGPELGLYSPPESAPDGTQGQTTLLVNAWWPAPDGEQVHLAASPAAQAGAALERDIRGLAPFAATARSPLEADIPVEKAALVFAGLGDGLQPAPRRLRRRLEDSLRRSWPTRRFALPARSPAWLYELLHLLGLCALGGRAVLELGPEWIDRRFASCLFGLIEEQFVVCAVRASSAGRHRVELLRKPAPAEVVTVSGEHGERQVPADRCGAELRSLIILALHLPPNLHRLLDSELLRIPAEEEWSALSEAGLRLFAASSLGRGLSHLVFGKRLSPDDEALAGTWREGACPLPAPEVLDHLLRLDEQTAERSEIDAELSFWLDAEPGEAGFAGGKSGRGGRRRRTVAAESDSVAREIASRVFVDGIPRFPEHYLFDYYRPELIDFAVAGPLRIVSSFFHSIELAGQSGERFEVEGEETALALVLASFGQDRTVSLPADRETTAGILQRYRSDLKQLRRRLVRETHARIGEAKSASALVERIWNRQGLPPWNIVDES